MKREADKLQAVLGSTYTALSTFGCKCHGEALTHFLCHCSEKDSRLRLHEPPMGEDEPRLSSSCDGDGQAAIRT